MAYTITITNWQAHREPLRRIRDQVFIQEQQVPVADEWDDKDDTAIHFLANNAEGDPIGCARLLVEESALHIGRVAVLADYRQQGVGRQLMQYVLAWCKQKNPAFNVYLHAQTSRKTFYEHLGFAAQGDIFMEAGIAHIEMWYQN
ncbi:MAG: GNAT family N-acetyltransferase [Cellvibrio sp.]